LGRLTASFDAIGQLVMAIERVLFVYVAITLALDAKLSVGMIFAFQAYKQQFLDAGMRLVEAAINYSLIKVHLTRISDVALSKQEGDGREVKSGPVRFEQGITVKNLYFRYGAGEPDVLKGVNLKIQPGEMIALVGPSGGGKTTLMKIMMGLFEPNHGSIMIGDTPLSSIDKRAYRRGIGSVAQDDMLYAGSIADNIAFFDPDIDMVKVEKSATLACIYDDIKAMPLGFDSLVGDMGSTLSGGQKQRILIARALYIEPKILFIDEGTAHLDEFSEEKLLKNLAELGITRITIAHRSKAINRATRVVMIAGGLAKVCEHNVQLDEGEQDAP
jgi:ATP-binding cassette subfamily B protein RaxB